MLRVVVIGAGVVGAAVAFRLAAGGARVCLAEAGQPGRGTSARSFAWLNGNDKQPPSYGRLNAEGVEAHRRLGRELGRAPWLHETGNVMFTDGDPAPLLARVARLRAQDYPAESISLARAREIEPSVEFGGATAAAWFPGEGWADGPRLVDVLVGAATERGARLIAASPVEGIAVGPGGVTVRAGGEALAADAVVVAAGRFTDRVAALAGIHVPLAPTCGLLALTGPVARGPRRVVYGPGVHFRPDARGGLLLQADDTDRMVGPDTPEAPDLPGCALLLERARRLVPALGRVRVEVARVGVRALPSDGHPIVGPVPFQPRVYLAVTHSGMTLAPLFGELIAEELLSGRSTPWLADYRPERCVVAL